MAKEKKDSKNLIVWRGKTCFVVMNLFPYNAGHLLIVPYKHTSNIEALSAAEHTEAMQATAKCLKALKKFNAPHGFNFGANLGRVAGAGIEHHVHFHIVPRWNGDTNFLPVLSDTKMISEDMRSMWKKLSALLAKA